MPSTHERRVALGFGQQAEAWVAEELRGQGWDVIEQNWHGGGGELDLIAVRDRCLRIVEVRARSGESEIPIHETIGSAKQRRLRRAAEAYLLVCPHPFDEVAFLVALVDLNERPWSVVWIDDAFDGS